MQFSFAKYAGCGNDFIIIDDRERLFPSKDSAAIHKLCHRKYGVGGDGLILLQDDDDADFRMRYYNADGKEAEMCGNGVRALRKFIAEKTVNDGACTIATLAGEMKASIVGENVMVAMPPIADMRWNLDIQLASHSYTVHFLNTGVPHVVLFVDDVATFDVEGLGRQFRHHPLFAPQGVNFNAACIAADGTLWNRTYERGVEAETLACGTGSIAAAIAAHTVHGLASPIQVMTRSEEILQIAFDAEGPAIVNLTMTGPAVKVFEGVLSSSR